jgi:hypothetical protein
MVLIRSLRAAEKKFTTLANAANLVSNWHPQPENGEVFGAFAIGTQVCFIAAEDPIRQGSKTAEGHPRQRVEYLNLWFP